MLGGSALPTAARGVRITVSTSWFVPKPHTAFQWDAQIPVEEYQRRVNLLRDALKRDRSITYNWHDPQTSYLEAIFSRGDRPPGRRAGARLQNGPIVRLLERVF